jgi:hypothetical protein
VAAPNTEPETWYWCLRHRRVERGSDTTCLPESRLGPYESQEAAEHWKDRVDARNERWDKEDKEWSGDD